MKKNQHTHTRAPNIAYWILHVNNKYTWQRVRREISSLTVLRFIYIDQFLKIMWIHIAVVYSINVYYLFFCFQSASGHFDIYQTPPRTHRVTVGVFSQNNLNLLFYRSRNKNYRCAFEKQCAHLWDQEITFETSLPFFCLWKLTNSDRALPIYLRSSIIVLVNTSYTALSCE